MTQIDEPIAELNDFTVEELQVWGRHIETYFVQLLNDEISLETTREDLASFRNGKWYTGDNPKYQELKEQPND